MWLNVTVMLQSVTTDPRDIQLETELAEAAARSDAFLARVERERAQRSLRLGMARHQAAMLGDVRLVELVR